MVSRTFLTLAFFVVTTSNPSGAQPEAECQIPEAQRARDAHCYIGPSEIDPWMARPSALVVDVRSPDAYSAVRIPGSVRLPLAGVASDAALRRRPIVLVGELLDGPSLESLCASVREEGAEMAILDGGLASWARSGRGLEGRPDAVVSVGLLRPDEFEWLHRFDHVLTLHAVGSDAEPIPGTVVLPASLGASARQAKIVAGLKRHGGDARTVVVLDDLARTRADLAPWFDGLPVPHLFVVEGGTAAWRAHRERRLAGEPARSSTCSVRR